MLLTLLLILEIDMCDTFVRRIRILQMLRRKIEGTITIPQMRERLSEGWEIGVAKRDIQKDMVYLSTIFPITCDDDTKPYQWYWSGNDLMDIPTMGRYSALTLRLAHDYLEPLMPRASLRHLDLHFKEAQRVLDEHPDELGGWLKKIRVVPRYFTRQRAEVADEILDSVYQALYENKRLHIAYAALSSGQLKEHILDPLVLAYRDSVTELLAVSDRSGEAGRFVLHRIQRAEVSDESITLPQTFDVEAKVQELLAFPKSGEQIKFKAWLHQNAVHHVKETPISVDQSLKQLKNGMEITATLRDTIELRWWIAGLGDRIKVLAPKTISDEIKENAQKMAELYK